MEYIANNGDMKFQRTSPDEAILSELGQRLARLRIAAGVTQSELAEKAGVGKRTLERLEAGESVHAVNLIRVMRFLGLLERLEAVLPARSAGPIALLKSQAKERQRASRKAAADSSSWKWEEPA